jgi:DNA-directed RNA polymerase specialized sigma24 family protein
MLGKIVQKKIEFKKLSHNQLIAYMARHSGDNAAWREFLTRFQNYIAAVIIKECKRINYSQGLNNLEDILQKVYLRLLDNDSRALRNFHGQYENAIVLYLKIITINVVRSEMKASSRERSVELDNRDENLLDLLPDNSTLDKMSSNDLNDAIKSCLRKIEHMRRNGVRDVLLFGYYFYKKFKIEEIAALQVFSELSQKRIANIVAEIKAELRDCLSREGYS